MIEITTFESFSRERGDWSYKRPAQAHRDLSGTIALLVSVSDTAPTDDEEERRRELHLRTVEQIDGQSTLSSPIMFDAPDESGTLDVRVLCLELEDDTDPDTLLDGSVPELDDRWGAGSHRTLFTDRWTIEATAPTGPQASTQTVRPSADPEGTIADDLAERGIRRVVSLCHDGTRSLERRRYRHRAEATDCALHIEYAA